MKKLLMLALIILACFTLQSCGSSSGYDGLWIVEMNDSQATLIPMKDYGAHLIKVRNEQMMAEDLPSLKFEMDGHVEHNKLIYRMYKIELLNPIEASKGILVFKMMDGQFIECGVEIDSDGKICQNGAPYTHAFNAGPGEKFEIVLASLDPNNKTKALAKSTFIPFPAKWRGEGNRVVELQIADLSGLRFSLAGTGFDPNQKLSIVLLAEKEKNTFEVITNEVGEFVTPISLPAKAAEGCFILHVLENELVTVGFRHYWGKIAFKDAPRFKELYEQYPAPIVDK